jgi:hypothetical protein
LSTAIVINLDYETQPVVKCRRLWKIIDTRMAVAGFKTNNRRFISNLDMEAACQKARAVIDAIEADYQTSGQSAKSFIRDFYAAPCSQIVSLSDPVKHSIEVDMMASGAYQRFFAK